MLISSLFQSAYIKENMYLPNTPATGEMWPKVNSQLLYIEFPSPKPVALPNLNKPVCPTINL